MINSQELLFIVDESNKSLEPKPRSFAHAHRLWHRTSGIWVLDKNKRILCQKRSLKKDVNPGIWEAFFGGHLAPEETYLENAANELGEELGIPVESKRLIPYKVFKSDKPTHKEFQQVFAVILDENENNFNVEKEEVDQLAWKSIDELKKILLNRDNPAWVQKPWDKEVLNWLLSLT